MFLKLLEKLGRKKTVLNDLYLKYFKIVTREKEIRLIIMGARYDKITTVLNLFDSPST